MKKDDNNFTIKDLPLEDRPREKMLATGPEFMEKQDLIALILNNGMKGEPVTTSAMNLISRFKNLDKLANASLQDLMKIKGLGPAKATRLAAAFELGKRVYNNKIESEKNRLKEQQIDDPEKAANIIRSQITDFEVEHYFIMCLDTRNRVIQTSEISTGIANMSVVHPRETFNTAIRNHAVSIMIAHNHPSGDLDPSAEDLKITRRIYEAGKILGIELLDHIIISKSSYYSFKVKGYL